MAERSEPVYLGAGVCERCKNKRRRLARTEYGVLCDTCIAEAVKGLRRAGGAIRRARMMDAEARRRCEE